jgi:hypothetical protein
MFAITKLTLPTDSSYTSQYSDWHPKVCLPKKLELNWILRLPASRPEFVSEADVQSTHLYAKQGLFFGFELTSVQAAVIARRSAGALPGIMPRVIDPGPSLEPEEKYAWDPSSFASPLYNPVDGGHPNPPSIKELSERTSRSPPKDPDLHARTNNVPQRQHVKSYPAQVARPRPDMLELPFYNSASSHKLWTGYGSDFVHSSQSLRTLLAPSESNLRPTTIDGGTPPSLNSLTSEWNSFMQACLGI